MVKVELLVFPDHDPNKLVDESWKVSRVAREAPPFSWEEAFREAQVYIDGDTYSSGIQDKLDEEEATGQRIYPLKADMFNAFRMTPVDMVKVVIIGQDPYHGTYGYLPQATGCSFSVRKGDKIPPSLMTVYAELARSIPEFKVPNHGDLSGWAWQGVLLLNMSLTVKAHKAGSLSELWKGWVYKIIDYLLLKKPNTIFLLWGRKAQALSIMLGDTKAVVLEAPHPSPLSRAHGSDYNFVGCGHFVEVNKILKSRGEHPIDWRL